MLVEEDIVAGGTVVLHDPQFRLFPDQPVGRGGVEAPALVSAAPRLGPDDLVPHLEETLFPVLEHTRVIEDSHFPGAILDQDWIPRMFSHLRRSQHQALSPLHDPVVVKEQLFQIVFRPDLNHPAPISLNFRMKPNSGKQGSMDNPRKQFDPDSGICAHV